MSLTQDEVMAIGIVIALKEKKKKRSTWTKDWLLKRYQISHTNIMKELKLQPDNWRNYMRMDETTYVELLNLVSPFITHKETVMRKCISPHERLSATLRFLATGRSLTDLRSSALMGTSTLSMIIPETCDAIYKALKKDYLKFPATEEEWKFVGEQFKSRWQFPHCLGGVDGKHVWITPPSGSGSYYWNYKGYNSLVLMTVVNANYEFILADIGTNGRVSDGRVIDNTEFGKRLKDEKLCLPPESIIANSECVLPYVFVGDEAFALRPDFMKPYSQKDLDNEKRIFNYRLSRARRVTENAFGIMASRFRIFHTCINLKLTSIEKVVMASVVLHNYLHKICPSDYSPEESFHREDRVRKITLPGLYADPKYLAGLQNGQGSQNYPEVAKVVRDRFMDYFVNVGAVAWQRDLI